MTYRDPARLGRLGELAVEPVKADVLDRAALRRALRGCDVVFHTAGYVASRPAERVWQINALARRAWWSRRRRPRASGGWCSPRRVGGDRHRAPATRSPTRRTSTAPAGGAGLRGLEARGRVGGAGGRRARCGWRSWSSTRHTCSAFRWTATQPGETSTANRRQLPARPAAGDRRRRDQHRGRARTWPRGTCSRPSAASPGERYILGGYNVALGRPDRPRRRAVRACSHPLLVLPRDVARSRAVQDELGCAARSPPRR